ncbi:MAG: hypothetical protein NDI77_15325, partial [Geobacteraceae bacterium]|nr:hypothetical protein [Geobacteraceae bacterium]
GAHAVRPYYVVADKDDPVKMVWHYHMFIQFNFLSNFSRFQPFLAYNLSQCRQSRLSCGDFC